MTLRETLEPTGTAYFLSLRQMDEIRVGRGIGRWALSEAGNRSNLWMNSIATMPITAAAAASTQRTRPPAFVCLKSDET